MSEKKIEYFYLSPKEESAMKVLWTTDEELSASEIANRIPNRNWPASSIQGILRSLEKKNAIKVTSITKIGKSYGRLFRPALSSNEYAAMQFRRYYQDSKEGSFSMVSSLLGSTSNNKDEVIEMLHALLEKYKEED